MFLLKINKNKIILTTIVVLICIIYFLLNKLQLYGNDQDSIQKVIRSIEGYEVGTIEILEMNDIADNRVVAFLYNNSPAFIQFYKNELGNYKWMYIEKHEGESLATFLYPLIGADSKYFMIVTNDQNEIAKMDLGINERIFEKKLKVNQASVSWIELPKTEDSSYTFSYQYYDKNGNQIKENS